MVRSVGEFIPSSSCGDSTAVSLTVTKSVQEIMAHSTSMLTYHYNKYICLPLHRYCSNIVIMMCVRVCVCLCVYVPRACKCSMTVH